MSGAALFGLALISGSKAVFALAVFSHLSHWWFLSYVEGYVPSLFLLQFPKSPFILILTPPRRTNQRMNEQPTHEALIW